MLYKKKDVFNALRQYIEVLNLDMSMAKSEETKQVIHNTIVSLEEIIKDFRG